MEDGLLAKAEPADGRNLVALGGVRERQDTSPVLLFEPSVIGHHEPRHAQKRVLGSRPARMGNEADDLGPRVFGVLDKLLQDGKSGGRNDRSRLAWIWRKIARGGVVSDDIGYLLSSCAIFHCVSSTLRLTQLRLVSSALGAPP